ncbi:hypothetical protein ACFV9G_05085 [Nocardioides sp. NPDC059952]|uniref:hypothetical protein n=1 Tax=Nocardioides sp. NPDC059952 TaxID=3347014 RepID=UPI003661BDC4
MDPSPRGREIRTVEGNPSGIISRGNWMETLGQMMKDCHDTLKDIAEHDLANGEMDGKAVEKLQDVIGDSYDKLDEAAELYTPVGPLIAKYGEDLQHWQPLILSQTEACEDAWAKLESMPDSPTRLPGTEPEEGSPEAQQEEADAQAREEAQREWDDASGTWDAYYDSWEDAYDEAVSGIGHEMSGKIKDGFWEVLDDIIAVLEFIGFVLFVVGMFVAGPIAAIALIVSALVFIGKLAQALGNGGGWDDVAWAALDLIPFGKFGKIGDAVGALDDTAKFGQKFAAGFKVAGGLDSAWEFKKFGDVITSLHTGMDIADFERLGSYGKVALAGLEVQGALAKTGGAYKSAVEAASGTLDTFTDNPFG